MRIKWRLADISQVKCDAVVLPISPTFEPLGEDAKKQLSNCGGELQKTIKSLVPSNVVCGWTASLNATKLLPNCKKIVVTIPPRLSSVHKINRSSESLLFACYINALRAASKSECKNVVLPILTLDECNFPTEESMLCALYGIFSYFQMDFSESQQVQHVTIIVKDINLFAQLSAFLPDVEGEMNFTDILSLNAQRKRLIDTYRPKTKNIVVVEYDGVTFGSFLKKYADKKEKALICERFSSLMGSSEHTQRQSRQEYMKNYMSQRRELDPSVKEKERAQKQKRRENSIVRQVENEARKSKRQNFAERQRENSARKARREDSAERQRENSARRARREDSTERQRENSARRARREDSTERQRENSARRARREDSAERQRENSARKARREDSAERQRENSARKARREDSAERQRENTLRKKRRQDPSVRQKENTAKKTRRALPKRREKENVARRLKRLTPSVKQRHQSAIRRRRESAAFRERERAYKKKRLQDEHIRQHTNAQRRQRRSNPEVREQENALQTVRYRTNPLLRAKKWISNLFRKTKMRNVSPSRRHTNNIVRRAKRRLFRSQSPDNCERRLEAMMTKAQETMVAKRQFLRAKALNMQRSCRRSAVTSDVNGTSDLRSRDILRARNTAFLNSLRRRNLPRHIRNEHHSLNLECTRSINNELLKIIVAQLVIRPRNLLTKKFIDDIVEEARTVYSQGVTVRTRLEKQLRDQQKYLSQAMEHKNKGLSAEQVIGGRRLHVKSSDKVPAGNYRPIDDFFKEVGEEPKIYHNFSDQEIDFGMNVMEDAAEYTEEETEIHRLLSDLLNQVAQFDTDTDRNTYGRLCDSRCVLPRCDWALRITLKLAPLCHTDKTPEYILQTISALTFCDSCELGECDNIGTCANVKRLLLSLAPHCQNIRSIIRRFCEIKRLSNWMYRWDKALQCSDLRNMFDLTREHGGMPEKSVTEHFQSESYVLTNFKKHMDRCRAKFQNHEVFPCASCTILYSKDQVKKFASDAEILVPIAKDLVPIPSEVIICKECSGSLKKGKVPILFTGNGLEIPFLPMELYDLNWLELLLLRKVRPIMATFLLSPLRGPGLNQMKGFKGSILHLPMEIEKTVNHIIEHLPSAEGLNVIVNTAPASVVKKMLKIDMEKVIRALIWLKSHNEVYKDICINADYNPVFEMIEKTMQGDPNLERSQHTPVCSADGNLEREEPNEELQLRQQGTSNAEEGALLTVEHIGLTSIDEPNIDVLPSTKLFNMNDMDGQPVNALEKDLDIQVFPELFPTGKFGMNYNRANAVSETKFLRRNLRSKFDRFRRNVSYIFWNANRKDVKTLLGSASIMVKKLTSGRSIFERINEKDNSVDDMLSTMFKQLRSHQEYWNNVKRELRTAITYFGSPTFFVTLNPAEYDWTELRDYYKVLYPTMSKKIGEFVAMDPVIFLRHFYRRIAAINSEVIRRKDGILGDVIHQFWRVEYQRRGAPHVHMLVWVRNAPQIGTDTNDTVAAFIDKYISCELRDAKKESILSELVQRYQIHRQPCSSTCATTFKHGRKRITVCRFMFPIPPSKKTVVLSEEERQNISGVNRMKKGYLLKRTEKEKFVNSYNCGLLMIWRGNIDIQMISNKTLKYVDYVTAYVGKGESKAVLDGIDLARSKCSIGDLVNFGMRLMRNREMGLAEAADRCLGHHLHYGDVDVVWLATNSKEERVRRLKNMREMEGAEKGCKETADNLVDVYYPQRSPLLEQFSLFNICMNFKTVSALPPKAKICTSSIDNTSSSTNPILPRMYWPNCEEGPEEQEDWARRVLLVFKPWRNEDHIIGNSDCFFDQYCTFINGAPIATKSQVNLYLNASDELQKTLRDKKKDYEELERIREEMGITEIEALEIQPIQSTEEEVSAGEQKLNEDQRNVYTRVMEAVTREDAHRQNDRIPFIPLRLLVSGVGGTGKTALIHQLASKVSVMYSIPERQKEEPAVLIAAPTGLAALAIKGNTLHSLLQLGFDNSGNSKYKKLGGIKLGELAVLFRNCRLFIIDEISMVSNIMLFKVCMRLCEIRNNNTAFGGMNIVVFGDLLQLPPVRANDVFRRLSTKDVRTVFHSLALNYSLWELFEYRELLQNMRQKNDVGYAELLNRVRIGSPTEADIRMLMSRMITSQESRKDNHAPRKATLEESAKFYVEKWKEESGIVALFSKVDTVEQFNKHVQSILGLEVTEVRAIDSVQQRISRKRGRKRPYQKIGFRRSDWGKSRKSIERQLRRNDKKDPFEGDRAGLPERICLALNSRVMLRRNLNVAVGLVNGAMGVIKDIVCDRKEKPVTIVVQFDNITEPVSIEKVSASFDLNGELIATRKQFPLLVAYAMTIHKSQGLTAKNILVSMEDAFAKGMCYVALSRATHLNGVHLIGFNPGKISANEAALTEYNRLRNQQGMELLPPGNAPAKVNINFFGDRRRKPMTKHAVHDISKKERRPRNIETAITDVNSEEQIRNNQHSTNDQSELEDCTQYSEAQVRRTKRKAPPDSRNVADNLINKSAKFIWFINRGSDCFVNSVVWCLLNSQLARYLRSGDPGNAICSFFANIYAANRQLKASPQELRNLFPQMAHGQHDVKEFYEELVQMLPRSIRMRMIVDNRIHERCLKCRMCGGHDEYMSVQSFYENPGRSPTFEGILQELSVRIPVRTLCSYCREVTDHEKFSLFVPYNQFMALEFPWANEESIAIRNVPDEIDLYDEKWKIASAVEYIPGGRHVWCNSFEKDLISWKFSKAKLVDLNTVHEKCTAFDLVVNLRNELKEIVILEMQNLCKVYNIDSKRQRRFVNFAVINMPLIDFNSGGGQLNATVVEELSNKTVTFEAKVAKTFQEISDDEIVKEWSIFFENILQNGKKFGARSLKFFPDDMWTRLGLNKTKDALEVLNMVHSPISCGEDHILVNVCYKKYGQEIKGQLFKVLHTGNFVNKGKIFRFKSLPTYLFSGDDNKMRFLSEKNCIQERNRYVCDLKETKFATSLDEFPSVFMPVSSQFTFVRHAGLRDLISSNAEIYDVIYSNGTSQTLPFPRSGVLLAGIPYDSSLKINGKFITTGRLPITELIHMPRLDSNDMIYNDIKEMEANIHVQEELLKHLINHVDSNWFDFFTDGVFWVIRNWKSLLLGAVCLIAAIGALIACYYCYPALTVCCECLECLCKKHKSNRRNRRRHSPSAPLPPSYDEYYEDYPHNIE